MQLFKIPVFVLICCFLAGCEGSNKIATNSHQISYEASAEYKLLLETREVIAARMHENFLIAKEKDIVLNEDEVALFTAETEIVYKAIRESTLSPQDFIQANGVNVFFSSPKLADNFKAIHQLRPDWLELLDDSAMAYFKFKEAYPNVHMD